MISFLIGPWGRIATIAAAFLAFSSWLVAYKYQQQHIGAQKLAAKIERVQNEKIEKARAARRSIDGVPDERLRDQFFRD